MLVQALAPVETVPLQESASVLHAALKMACKRSAALLVVNQSGALTGILTDQDVAYLVASSEDLKVTPVAQVMTFNPVRAHQTDDARTALQKMAAGCFRHLPVCPQTDFDYAERFLRLTPAGTLLK
jgi:CBS domain-containing protein